MKRIYPKFLPYWFRPIYCFFHGHKPTDVPRDSIVKITCGICGKVLYTK